MATGARSASCAACSRTSANGRKTPLWGDTFRIAAKNSIGNGYSTSAAGIKAFSAVWTNCGNSLKRM